MTDIDEDRLLKAFNKTLKEYDGEPWESVFHQEFVSHDMFVSPGNRVFATRAINHREFVRKMLEHLR